MGIWGEKCKAFFTYINAFSQLTAEKYLWVYYTHSLLHCFCIQNWEFHIKKTFHMDKTIIFKNLLVMCSVSQSKQNPYLFLRSSFSLICSSSFTLRLSFPNCKDRTHTSYIDTTILKGVRVCCSFIINNPLTKKKTVYVWLERGRENNR